MSKTKKYKYFRKNRRGKNGKNSKHKTRRVQRGGHENETHPTASLQTHPTTSLQTHPTASLQTPHTASLQTPHTASLHSHDSHPPLPTPPSGKSAAEAAATQALNQPHTQQQPTQALNQLHTQQAAQQAAQQQPTHQPPDTGVGLNPPADMGPNKGTPADPLGASHGATPDARKTKAAPVSAAAQQAAESSPPPQPQAVVPTGASSGAATQTYYGNYDGQLMGNSLGYPTGHETSAVSNANDVSSGSSVPNISDSKPRLTSVTPEELKSMSDEAKIAYLSRNAIARNQARQKPDKRITLIANTIPAAILGRLASIGKESQKDLVEEEVLVEFTKEFPKMMKDSNQVREAVEYYNDLLLKEIDEICKEIEGTGEITDKNQKDISNLQSIVKSNIEFINQAVIEPSLLRHALLTGSLASAQSPYAPSDPSSSSSKSDGILSRMGEKLRNFGNSFSSKNKNYQKLADESGDTNKKGFVSKVKGFFTRKNNKVAPEHTAETTPPETTPAEVTHAEETQAVETPEARRKRELDEHKKKQDELYETHGLTRSPGGLTRFTQGVAKKYNNAMGAVKKGFTDLKQKFSKDTTDEAKPLLGDTEAQKKTWKEKFTFKNMKESAREGVKSLRKTAKSVKDAAVNRLTRKNKGSTEENKEENTQLLSPKGSDVEMQTLQPQEAEQLEQQPEQPEAPRKPPPPLPPPRQTTLSQDSASSSDSKLSQRSTVDKSVPTNVGDVELPSKISTQPPSTSSNDWDKDNEEEETRKANLERLKVGIKQIGTQIVGNKNSPTELFNINPLASPPPVSPRQRYRQLDALAAGGKTRKNRQYIHEIKENRTHLFNKEMQILNSIRNFKNGQHHGPNERGKNKPENIQKKFIKVIKRS